MLWASALDTDDHDVNIAAFSHICNTVANLIALALINGLSLRGGLAFGECYINPAKQLAVGEPIVDAYLLDKSKNGSARPSALGSFVSQRRPSS
jgi:hypothetical protein